MHEGYLEFAGTEVINASRTRAYMKAFTPGLSLRTECCSCEDLAVALGDDEYGSPQQDGAPWFSPTNPATAGFYGLIPLGLQGFEDSTMTTAVVENVQEGASFGRPRRASRPLRVSALAVAQSEASMDAGLAWLRDVLNDSGCVEGDCSGASLCWLAACPTVCEEQDDLIVDLHISTMSKEEVTAAAASWRHDNSRFEWVPPSSTAGTRPAVAGIYTSGDGGAVYIPLDGLVPGGIYRVEYDISSSGATAIAGPISVPGMSSEYPLSRDPGGSVIGWRAWRFPDMDRATEVFEFTASAATAEVKVEIPTGFYYAYISGLRVRRVEQHSVRMQRWGYTAPGSWSGEIETVKDPSIPTNHVWPTTMTWGPDLTADIVPTYKNLPAFSFGGRFKVTGLTPGVPARLVIGGEWMTWDILGDEGLGQTTTDKALGVEVDGVRYTSAEPGQSVIEFTPTAQAVDVFVGNRTNHTYRASTYRQTLRVTLQMVRVEQFVGGDSSGLRLGGLRRTLGSVSATSGPAVTGVYPERSAVIRKIEWEMTAGSPRVTGDPLPAVTNPNIPVVVSADRRCENGSLVQENLFLNPSFEASVAGWTLDGSEAVFTNFTLTRASVPDAVDGSYVMRLTYTGASAQAINTVQIRSVQQQVSGWSPGDRYTFSYSARASRAGFYGTMNANYQNNTLYIAYNRQPLPDLDATNWIRSSASWTVAYGTDAIQFVIDLEPPWVSPQGEWLPGDFVEFDAFRMARASATVYFDGDYPNATWLGLPNASISEMVQPVPGAVVDPDCPQPPAPPAPPIPEVSCLDLPASWRRRFVTVESRMTQVAQAAAPVLTLTSGMEAARSVRVRVFADPFQRGIDELDPCSACGEFVVSYLPPNAVMTIDSVDRRVSVSMDGATQPADHLIYDSSGGPVIWPEMTCGVPYIIEIGVDSDSDAIVDLTADIVPLY